MKTLQFKTNIKCSGCVAAVTPVLNNTPGIEKWEVDTENPDKILTVSTDSLSEQEVVKAVEKAGYTATAK